VLAGDLNIQLKRTTDLYTIQFVELLACHGLVQHIQSMTHVDGGTIDVICTCSDLPALTVNILNVGLSDHRQLRWLSPFVRPPPVYMTANHRLWRFLTSDSFLSSLQVSALFYVQHLDGNALVQFYSTTISEQLDVQIPVRRVTRRQRRRACGLMTNVVEQSRC